MTREAVVRLGLLSVAWAARHEALRHDAECSADPARAAELCREVKRAAWFRARVCNAAILACKTMMKRREGTC